LRFVNIYNDIDMLQSCIEFDGWFQGGLLEAPCTLSNQVFRGVTGSFRGARPPRAPS